MSKIELTDSTLDVVTKMSEGNPGAVHVIMALLTESEKIDPDAAMGGLAPILLLDTWNIYETDIYVLANDKCEKDLRKLVALLRATQMGKFSQHRLHELSKDQSRSLNISEEEWETIEAAVEELPNFQKAEQEVSAA